MLRVFSSDSPVVLTYDTEAIVIRFIYLPEFSVVASQKINASNVLCEL